MENYLEKLNLKDDRGRRFFFNRRQFFYTMHFPERRSGIYRRSGEDRRESQRIK